jgi:hypothetical protein
MRLFSFPKNVFSAFAVLFFISAALIPLQNLAVWGPEMVLDFYISQEITSEKVSVGVFGLGIFMIFLAHKKRNSIEEGKF